MLVHVFSGITEVGFQILEEFEDLRNGTLFGEVLSQFDKSLGEMAPGGGGFQILGELSDVGLGFGDFSERSTTSLEASKKSDAFIDGVKGGVRFSDVLFVLGLSGLSVSGGLSKIFFGLSDKLNIDVDEFLISGSLWVKGVLEMVFGNSESEFGIGQLFFPFLVEFEVLGLGPSVFLVFRVKLEVQVSDEVLEGGNEFRHGTSSFDLKFHEACGDLSPTGFLHVVDGVLHGQLEGRFNGH